MRKAIAIVALTILAACGGGDEEGWSDANRNDYIAGCESSGTSTESCECAADKLEEAYPDLQDPADIDPDKLVEVAEECAE